MAFLIGIDLGTTNSALAYIDLAHREKGIQHFRVPQPVAPGEVAPRDLLPSFLYLPGPHDPPLLRDEGRRAGGKEEASSGSPQAPHPSPLPVVGELGRNYGARVPGRLVTSAKSWLSHAGVDRTAPLLPWTAPPEVERISPVQASTRYLHHLAEAWNATHARTDAARRLEKQAIVLTVPASFDDVARTLTVEAARKAGFENLTLLEEPQAAFYCWLARNSDEWRVISDERSEAGQTSEIEKLSALVTRHSSLVTTLVIDVGGGTSDFSLIQTVEEQGQLGFVRQAVGDHLLLGGDNMDLALAKFVETRLPAAGKLDAVQYGLLTQACRQAKEALLGPNPPAEYTVTVVGRGRQVIGAAQHASLKYDDVRQVVLDGFFPVVPYDSEPKRGGRVGLHEMGLPYVHDPAITRHLAAFLHKHFPASSDAAPITAVLFNGGVFTPAVLRERIVEVLRHWFDRPGRAWRPLVLTNPSLDLAVAIGAAHFAWLKHTGGRRIGGGIARSYYTGVESRADRAEMVTVVCVVPQHLEEGREIVLEKPELELALGQPVAFPLYTSTVRPADQPGALLEVAPQQLLQLPPLHTVLRGGKRSGTKTVPVSLAARVTEIGTLELYCVARDGNNRWRLEFNVRDLICDEGQATSDEKVSGPSALNTENDTARPAPLATDVWPEGPVQEAGKLIRAVYVDKAAEPAPQTLSKAIEAALEAPRDQWPISLCRRLWDFLAEVADERRSSPGHLARWFNLAGFSLRPGFGDPLDKFRVEQLWKILHAPPKNAPKGKASLGPREGGADYWIMWRRVAAGLPVTLQNTLYTRLRAVLLPQKGKSIVKPAANEWTEMWRAAASLERLDVKQKELLAQALLKTTRRSPAPPHAFFSLTRLGARVLLYGPLNAVVHPHVVQCWIDSLLPFEPGHDSERHAWAFCLVQLSRRSGQRALDVDDVHRAAVLDRLGSQQIPAHWRRMVEDVVELEAEEQSQMFGEALPIGLRLIRDPEEA